MPFKNRRAPLILDADVRDELTRISRSRTEPVHRSERALILLGFADGESVSTLARRMGTNRPRIDRTIARALEVGVKPSLNDIHRPGRTRSITQEARAWVVSLACQKPKELGYAQELWTTDLLARHVREHCEAAGHPSLGSLARGTVSKILMKREVRPHKIEYYLERRDPDFEAKMAQVLCVYREVRLLREAEGDISTMTVILSFDEKPGIQAIGNVSPDLSPVPGRHPTISRDHEYVRNGTVTLMAGIDLLTGQIHAQVVDSPNSAEFIGLLQRIHRQYPVTARIRIILDNHSVHISKETRVFLATVPGRFQFIHTPKHGSWLNIIETFFAKMTKTLLRGIRVSSREELKERLEKYIREVNESPVVHRWSWGLDDMEVA